MNMRIPLTTLLLGAAMTAQMEKRENDLYQRAQFLAVAPTLDSMAPDLVLTDLEGRLQALSSYRGRVLVLIKGAFT
jgi:hypothetical protein